MYLTEPKLFDVVKQQLKFKLNANAATFTTLIVLQTIIIFISSAGNYSSGMTSGAFTSTWIGLSNDLIVGLTFLWALGTGFSLTTAGQRSEVFSFVTNRLSHNVSSFLFMLIASLIAGISAALSGSVIKLLGFMRYSEIMTGTPGLVAAPSDFFLRIITAICYVLLFFLIGYTIGSFIQYNKLFAGVLVIVWIVLATTTNYWDGPAFSSIIIEFYSHESMLFLFLIKVGVTICALFAASAAITNRLEVRN